MLKQRVERLEFRTRPERDYLVVELRQLDGESQERAEERSLRELGLTRESLEQFRLIVWVRSFSRR